MSRRTVHIVPADSGWALRHEGQRAPISRHRTQASADKAGRSLASRNGVELVIRGRDGKIRDKDGFGNDPPPPRDRLHFSKERYVNSK